MNRFGIQLYSLKDEIKLHGLGNVLKMVKEAGYDCVEFAGFYGLSPEALREILEEHGLDGVSAHMSPDQVIEQIEYIDKLGIERVYIAGIWGDATVGEGYRATVESMKKAKALLDERGIVYGYHNHSHEYENGGDLVEQLLRDVDGLTSQLDIFWAKVAGYEPTDLMNKYGEKLSCIHVKELDKRFVMGENARQYPCAIVGEGQANAEGAIKLAKKMGINTFILEVEGFPCEVETYLKKSFENMKKFAEE